MNRRTFFAVAAAVIAAPLAVAKGWFEKSKARCFPGPNDVIGWTNWTETYKPRACDGCYCEESQEYISHYSQLVGQPRRPSFINLCDPCAEKQGYLCEDRENAFVYPWLLPGHGCMCGKRGCPSLKMNWSNKINPYKPPVTQDFQKAIDRQNISHHV